MGGKIEQAVMVYIMGSEDDSSSSLETARLIPVYEASSANDDVTDFLSKL
jgi:hypothetical protein